MNTWEWDWSTTSENIVVEYNFTPGDPGVRYYADGSGEPPTPWSVDLVRFKYRGVDITELIDAFLDHDVLDELEREIAEHEDVEPDPDDFR